MSIICSNCKTENKPTSSYCVNCGHLLSGAQKAVVISQAEYDDLREKEKDLKLINSNNGQAGSYVLVLTDAGPAKLQVVKAVKETFGLGLKEAKDLVDGAPSVLDTYSADYKAETIRRRMEETGCSVKVVPLRNIPVGHVVIKRDYYNQMRDKIDEMLERLDSQENELDSTQDFQWSDTEDENDIWYRKMMDAMKGTTNSSKIEIPREEYERLKDRAEMTLWGKLKETLGF